MQITLKIGKLAFARQNQWQIARSAYFHIRSSKLEHGKRRNPPAFNFQLAALP